MEEGLRYNEGKTRHDLVPSFAQEQYAKVLTIGANKYAERNWEKGMKWSKVTASLKRHIAAFENGEDFDKETGLLHLAHAMCNAAFLVQYYKTYPQGDDRSHNYYKQYRIGLDIDEVLADWVGAMIKRFNLTERAVYWNDFYLSDNFNAIKEDVQFWLNIEPKIDPTTLPFEPVCYVTSRPIDSGITTQWLFEQGFPKAPVVSLSNGMSKIDALKEHNVDIFVDDRFDTFVELNKNGICCFLMDAPHNRRYNVGYKRISNFSEIFNKF